MYTMTALANISSDEPLAFFNPHENDRIKEPSRFRIIIHAVKNFFIDLFSAIGEAFKNRSPFSKICKFTVNLLTGIAHKAGHAFRGAGLLKVLSITEGVLDLGDLAADAHEVLNEKRDPAKKWAFGATVALLVADVGGFFLFLDELAFISLSKFSETIGKGLSKLAEGVCKGFVHTWNVLKKTYPMLGKVVAKISLLNIIRGIVTAAFVCLLVQETKNLIQAIRAKQIHDVMRSLFNLASYIAEIVLKVLVIVGCITTPGIVALSCIAAGLGLAAFIYEVVRDYQKERALEHVNKEAPLEILKV